jgi:TM2 domain-containing membrane protein YozV
MLYSRTIMASTHKNKTLATFLALFLGGLGIHRFYLHGWNDRWGWVHFMTLPLSLGIAFNAPDQPWLFVGSAFVLSVLVGFIETLVIGLTPDDKWDTQFNQNSNRQSQSGWPLVLLLIATLGGGSIVLFFILARTVDLLYTGGAYG